MPRPFRSPVAVGVITAVAAAAAENLYAFFFSAAGSEMAAATYTNGTYSSLRGSIAWADTATYQAHPIRTDPLGNVGDGSLLMFGSDADTGSGDIGVTVYDVEGNTTHTATLGDATWRAGTTTGGQAVVGGYFYWIERNHLTGSFVEITARLRRMALDCTGATTIATATSTGFSSDVINSTGSTFGVDSAMFYCDHGSGAGDVGRWIARFTYAGVDSQDTSQFNGLTGGFPAVASTAYRPSDTGGVTYSATSAGLLESWTDDSATAPTSSTVADHSGEATYPNSSTRMVFNSAGTQASLHDKADGTVYIATLPGNTVDAVTIGAPGGGLLLVNLDTVFLI